LYGRLTSRLRVLPDYIIIGAQRSGTTSLHKYLIQHPAIATPATKEPRFFDVHFARGVGWYKSFFPTRKQLDNRIVGEASPDYFFHPLAPRRVADCLPDVRLILLLRDPVERAFSHYCHQVALGYEKRGFQEAIAAEEELLAGEEAAMRRNPNYMSFVRDHFSYLARGLYGHQLKWWLEVMPRDRLLIRPAESLYEEPDGTYNEVLRFLGVSAYSLSRYHAANAFSQGSLPEATRSRLVDYFRPHNERLSELVGRDLGWA
jgi:Sulfotransferase domain